MRRLTVLLLLAGTPAAAQEPPSAAAQDASSAADPETSPAPAQEASPASAGEASLTLEDYRRALESLAGGLESGDWEGARALGGTLRGARVAAGETVFEVDPTLLAAVDGAHDAARAARARLRVLQVLASLDAAGSAGPEPDAARLARLAREEAARRPREGGSIDASLDASLDVRPLSLPERLKQWLDRAATWVVEWVRKILDWLSRAGPRRRGDKGGATARVVTVLVATIAIVLAVAAVRSMRRRDLAEARGEAEKAAPERDEDPLSRDSAEWERYAGELAAAGRRREAIRAWYHAVLVALFRAGRLHHQKGRTNWEYVGQVRPEAGWRGTFVSLTEVFDREWYGRDVSAPEALRECVARARELLRSVRGEAVA